MHEVITRTGEEGVKVAGPPARHLLQRNNGPLRRLGAELRQHLVEPRALFEVGRRVQLCVVCTGMMDVGFGSIQYRKEGRTREKRTGRSRGWE